MEIKEHKFYKLSSEAQLEILKELDLAIKWRGWDQIKRKQGVYTHATEHVGNISNIYEINGIYFEEYC